MHVAFEKLKAKEQNAKAMEFLLQNQADINLSMTRVYYLLRQFTRWKRLPQNKRFALRLHKYQNFDLFDVIIAGEG